MMFSYLAYYLRMSGSKVWEDLARIVEVENELTTIGTFLRTVSHGVVKRLTPDDMTSVCGEGGVPIRVCKV